MLAPLHHIFELSILVLQLIWHCLTNLLSKRPSLVPSDHVKNVGLEESLVMTFVKYSLNCSMTCIMLWNFAFRRCFDS